EGWGGRRLSASATAWVIAGVTGLAPLVVVLAFWDLAYESVVGLGCCRATDVERGVVHEDPRQRTRCLVRRVGSLVLQQKVGQPREELVLCLRQRALGM